MSKLSAERLAEIKTLAKWDSEGTPPTAFDIAVVVLLDHIAELQAEVDALARVADAAMSYLVSGIESDLCKALRAAGRLP